MQINIMLCQLFKNDEMMFYKQLLKAPVFKNDEMISLKASDIIKNLLKDETEMNFYMK